MSCPAQNAPIRERLRSLDEDIPLPPSFYVMTILMIATVISIPLLYRRIWLFLYDLVADVRNDLKIPDRPAGCRKVGRPGTSNLSKDFQPKKSNSLFEKDQNVDSNGPAKGKIEALFIHPIKSTAPIEVDSATVTPLGLAHDRLFSFAQQTTSLPDPESNKVNSAWVFLTQRSHARLSLIKTELWFPDPDAPDYDEDSEWVKAGGCVVVRFPFTQDIDRSRDGLRAFLGLLIARLRARSYSAEPIVEFRLPLNPSEERIEKKGYRLEKIKIWREEPEAWNMEPEIPYKILAKLKFHLGLSNPVTIFRVRDGDERVLYKCAPGEDRIGYRAKVAFHDSYPIHVQYLPAIHDLESHVPRTTKFTPDSRQFRANMYISGTPYTENNITQMSISTTSQEESGSLLFAVPSRTPSSTIPNDDPSTANRSRTHEPLKTRNSYQVIDEETNSPCLALHAAPLGTAVGGTIRVGDEVVLDGGDQHLYNKDLTEEAWTEI